jgi:hypothetical protein
MRTSLNGENLADTATGRRLKKYRFAAEFLKDVGVLFADSFSLDIGDIVSFDLGPLKISDIQTGDRFGEPRLFECTNKSLDIKTGDVRLELTDTNFDKDARYGLISPSSNIKSGTDGLTFLIEETGNSEFGKNEFKKWEDFIGAAIEVRSPDFTVRGFSTLKSIAGNTISMDTDLGFTPLAGYIMLFDEYDKQPDTVTVIYGFMNDAAFADGKPQYFML